jgi:FKBP-type peptidyl-prolyl cis-trans isomerase FklB
VQIERTIRGNQPTEFPVNGVIACWTEAIQLMNVDSKWKLFIPHDQAYGAQDAGGAIGPYQALVFEIELLEIL